ncbi:Histone acetyltransferase GCN5 [Micractinium conductrix]|uniref:histone acetyltransferase n=1 Tax=Micractinium conductrix TaxID=554055 RepID=A0A2P6VAC1_9CHLO|nr:Histone acetyltransferase GCN5 [Micractinium conductrix]|eukprot:PSC71001.1 Histone acetyltransferase GCN5 [Micractinium conductrix]
MSREARHMERERTGELSARYVTNDGNVENGRFLIGLKNVFSKCLPNMPKEYICRLIFERRHKSVVIVRNCHQVIGGITYRTFPGTPAGRLGEIAFCAVAQTLQVTGYGTRLMNWTKHYAREMDGLEAFLTYADNNAVGYFSKQNFTKVVTLEKEKWFGFIKDYDGGTLMECRIHPTLPYATFPEMLAKQRGALEGEVKRYTTGHVVHPGLPHWKEGGGLMPVDHIPGVMEAGWSLAAGMLYKTYQIAMDGKIYDPTEEHLYAFMDLLLRRAKRHADARPFLVPVPAEDVPDYYTIIVDPMDLGTMEERLRSRTYYNTLNMFAADFYKMVKNCQLYNGAQNPYFLAAKRLYEGFWATMRSSILPSLDAAGITMARSAVGRALGYPGQRIEAAALEAALQATLADLPFLAGRLGGIKWKLGTLAVVHTDGGAVLSVADAKDVTVAAAMAPAGWTQRGIAVASPAWPSYLEPMEVGGSMMSGKEPLLKVRLTKLSDGDILGVTYCHALFCGHRWPAFMAHLAERYREALGGSPADPAALLRPNDRTLFSAQHMATQLLGKGSSWEPPKERLLFSLAGLFGLLRLVHANAKEQRDLLLLHLPHSQVQALKAVAAKGNSDLVISTGDVVQATAGLVMHAALGLPLLPVEPKGMHVVMQVSLPAGTAQPADGDGVAAVQALAGAIRGAIAAFRSNPEEALTTLAHTQLMTEAPLRTLTHLARHLLPHIQSVTNYVPKQEPDAFTPCLGPARVPLRPGTRSRSARYALAQGERHHCRSRSRAAAPLHPTPLRPKRFNLQAHRPPTHVPSGVETTVMKVASEPVSLEVVKQTLIKPDTAGGGGGGDGGGAAERTALSSFDQTIVATAIGRALGYPGQRIDATTLEAALQATVTDLPFLAGRLGGMTGWKLGTLAVLHTGGGAVFSVAQAQDATVAAALAPAGWEQRGITISSPAWPFYLEPMEVDGSLLNGKEPLLKVRLTKLSDGDVLGVTYCHALFDRTRWPAFMAHLAERYRQAATGGAADPAVLLHPADRTLLSAEHMAKQLLGDGDTWQPPKLRVRSSCIAGTFRLACLMLGNAMQRRDLLLLHLPQQQIEALKATAAEGNPDQRISTGDAVQAATGLLVHAALGLPLLPLAPKSMAVLVQLPTPDGYFGNASRMLKISLPAGNAQPAEGDAAGALQALAGAIRRATAAFRSNPEEPLAALADNESLAGAPLLRMLAFLAQHRLPLISCVTNYVPKPEGTDLGLGQPATYDRELTYPLAREMAVIRPAVPPYSAGLFVQLCLAPRQVAALKSSALLAQLLPEASFVGVA